jgi:hypothetical protein
MRRGRGASVAARGARQPRDPSRRPAAHGRLTRDRPADGLTLDTTLEDAAYRASANQRSADSGADSCAYDSWANTASFARVRRRPDFVVAWVFPAAALLAACVRFQQSDRRQSGCCSRACNTRVPSKHRARRAHARGSDLRQDSSHSCHSLIILACVFPSWTIAHRTQFNRESIDAERSRGCASRGCAILSVRV